MWRGGFWKGWGMRCWIRGDDDGEGGVCGGELRRQKCCRY
jgi:hypothetical protein